MAERKRSQAKDLSPQKIRRIRAMREAAARRRRLIEGVLALIFIAVLVCGVVFDFSLLWVIIPGVLLLTVLAFGIRTSRHALEWERRVAASSRARGAQKSARSAKPVKKAVRAPKSGRQAARKHQASAQNHAAPAKQVAASVSQEPIEVVSEEIDSQVMDAPSIETAPTFIIPLDDVRSILREQFEESQAEQEKADREHAEAAAKAAKSADKADKADKKSSAQANSVKNAESAAKTADAEAEAVESREITSYKQVAKAVPLTGAKKRAVLADATPSVTMAAARQADSDTAAVEKHSAAELDSERDSEELVDVNAFGSDVDSILARRRR